MASATLPIRRRPRSRSEARPTLTLSGHQHLSAHAPFAVPLRPPHSFSRPLPPKINIDTHQQTPRRGTGNLALQARDSISARKRTMSTGAMSARSARQTARKASVGSSQLRDASPSSSARGRAPSRTPTVTPSTRTDSHPNRASRSPSPSSSSPSPSPTPVTPGYPVLSGAPSSYHAHTRTHVPHNSQGTTTSAYPPSSSHSSRSSSPSPERSRTPSPLLKPQKPAINSTPHTPSLDLDPDDVNARLRLLVNNSYYLPPAHTKPELSPIYLTPTSMKGVTSPSAFREFFRVGKKREKKVTQMNGFASPGGKRGMPPLDSPRSTSAGSDGRYGAVRHGDGYFDLQPHVGPARNRVVVVRETVESLPPPAIRTPLRTSSLPTHIRPRTAPETTFIDPTTQYDMPPPTHYPSYTNLRLDASTAGNVELDQFAPPGEPWSPNPTSPRSSRGNRSPNGSGMDLRERVWRRALLEQAVDLSLSSAASDPGHASPSPHDESFTAGLRVAVDLNKAESAGPTSPKSPRSKKSWWGKRDREVLEDVPPRPSSSSSNNERDLLRSFSSERITRIPETRVQQLLTPQHSKRSLGQCILPNVHAEFEEFEREHARRQKEESVGLPPPLRLKSLLPFRAASISAPVTPIFQSDQPPTPPLPVTPLRPRPAYRRSEVRKDLNVFGESVTREFIPGHSTIRRSLSSPLLSDLHEVGVDVEGPMTFPSGSVESLDGVAAPSLVLQDPHGVRSLVPSNTADSFTSGSHYSDDDQEMFDTVMTPHEQQFGFPEEDAASLDRWNASLSSPDHGDGRPSFDSFGASRVRSPEGDCPARASSTFGFRGSNISVANPSLLRGSHHDIEVDISGDPIEHLSLMESQRSVSPSAESHTSSVRGYASALDTFHGSEAPSLRPSSPASRSFRSTGTKFTSVNHQPGRSQPPGETATPAPISFFDSVQHQSYMDGGGESSDSDADVDEPPNIQSAHYSDSPSHTQTLGRKSLNTTRPIPAFATQFRNASQPQLPIVHGDAGPSLESVLRPVQPYDLLDRKKPLTNTPFSTSPVTSHGVLSQFKAKSGKTPRSFTNRGKKKSKSPPVVLPESTFELLRYPHGSAFSLGTSVGAATVSDAGSADVPGVFEGVRSQASLPSLQSSAASIKQIHSWRQEQIAQDESVRKLDGMLVQHLEAEKDRLRKIATAAREKGKDRPR